jgi:DNA-binding NarL/FixJ family response regulator
MSELTAPVRIEGGPVADGFLAGIGRSAVGSHERFTEIQQQVLLLASLGGTTEEVAGLLACNEVEITDARDSLIEIYGARNTAEVVSKAILGRHLPIEVSSDPGLRLSRRDIVLLDGFRHGLSNKEIGRHKQIGKSKDIVRQRYSWPLFAKIGANGRTHSVRRSYELGIWPI